jgi:polysaccharide deacetylase family protein (PEP-CTERM system associated)
MMKAKIVNAMTVDVEDYFQVAALADAIDRSGWDQIRLRVEDNTDRILDIFAEADIRATFFVLGWVAERRQQIVRKIVDAGHELACHGYSHKLIYDQDRSDFASETIRAKEILQEISGKPVHGYRAASYSITARSLWALDIIAEAGFTYDASIVPARHDLYGIPGAKVSPYRLDLENGMSLMEFPPSTINILGHDMPIGGGGYFRIFPYAFSRWGMRKINDSRQQPFAFYLHPWEIDPDQPRVRTNWKSRFRHYHNLRQFEPRLRRLLGEFQFGAMRTIVDSGTYETVQFSELEKLAARSGV